MEKSSFVRYDPSVHEVMQRLLSELTGRSNKGQLVLTSLRRSELQRDLYIPRYEILRPSSVYKSQKFRKFDDNFVATEYLNEYSSVAETRRTKLQSEVGSASMSRSKNK